MSARSPGWLVGLRREHLDTVLRTSDAAQLRVIANFLAELTGPAAGAPVSLPPSAGGRGSGTTSSSGS